MDQIDAALAAVKNGDKIICGSNIEFDNNMFVIRNIEFHFDFNGYTLSNTVDICKQFDWSFFSVRGGKMIFDDSKGTGGIKAKANDCYCLDIQNDKASIEINGGSYNGNITAVYVVAGNLVINGGYFDIQQLDDESPYGFVVNAYDAYFKNGIATMVVKGGRTFRFSAVVVVGDENGHVGVGNGKASEVPDAIRKAIEEAKKNLIEVPVVGTTIPHEYIGKFGSASVLLKPAAEGTGLIAGGSVRPVLELAGYRDIRTKVIGTNNPRNVVYATLEGLKSMKTAEQIAKKRGKTVAEIL